MHDGQPCSYGRKSTKTIKPARKVTKTMPKPKPMPKRRGK